MEKHSCKTYFSVNFGFDRAKNIALLKERRNCLPEEIGISNKDEVEAYIIQTFGVKPEWNRHHFIIGSNEDYKSDVNEMLRVTLKNLFGKEEKLREMQKIFQVTCVLEIVPYIASRSEEPSQRLSPDRDIIEFIYNSGTAMDMDYYVI